MEKSWEKELRMSTSMKSVVVPEGMLEAARTSILKRAGQALSFDQMTYLNVEAALQWLADNPIVPTNEQANNLWEIALCVDDIKNETDHAAKNLAMAWQRVMFLAPEPIMPKELHDLTWRNSNGPAGKVSLSFKEMDDRILEAFRRGQKSGSK